MTDSSAGVLISVAALAVIAAVIVCVRGTMPQQRTAAAISFWSLGASGKSTMNTTGTQMDVVERLLVEQPQFHLGGSVDWKSPPDTLRAIAAAVDASRTTLEVGVGASTVVFAAAGASHTAISPDPQEHELVRDYCRRIGIDDGRVSFLAGFSEDLLPTLLGPERTLDIAFIDGAHSFPFPEIDWFFVARSLKPGGRLILDDITIPSVAPVFRHMSMEPNWTLDQVLDNRGAAFTLRSPPPPGDDWLGQAMNSGYPDFGFAAPKERLKLITQHQVTQARQALAHKSPALARIYRQARAKRSKPPVR